MPSRRRTSHLGGRTLFATALLFVPFTVIGLWASYAVAATQPQQGWWWTANPGIGTLTPPPPPNVPADGLYVQGGASSTSGASDSSPFAFSALVMQIPTGRVANTLVLQAASAPAGPSATLELCPLSVLSLVKPEQGGPIADAPAYSCAHWVTATPDATGSSYRFEVKDFVRSGVLAVAVLPTSPISQVVLNHPGSSALELVQAGPTSGPTGTGVTPGSVPTGVTGTTVATSSPLPGSGVSVGGSSYVVSGQPSSGGAQSKAPAFASQPASAPGVAPAGSSVTPLGRSTNPTKIPYWVAFLLPLALLAGAGYLGWAFTVTPDREGVESPVITETPEWRPARQSRAAPAMSSGR